MTWLPANATTAAAVLFGRSPREMRSIKTKEAIETIEATVNPDHAMRLKPVEPDAFANHMLGQITAMPRHRTTQANNRQLALLILGPGALSSAKRSDAVPHHWVTKCKWVWVI